MSIFSAQKIYLMGLNRSLLVNVFSIEIRDSVAGSVLGVLLSQVYWKSTDFQMFLGKSNGF